MCVSLSLPRPIIISLSGVDINIFARSISGSAGDWLIYWHICVRRLYSHILIVWQAAFGVEHRPLKTTNSGRLICAQRTDEYSGQTRPDQLPDQTRPNGEPSDIRYLSQKGGGNLSKKTSKAHSWEDPAETSVGVSLLC